MADVHDDTTSLWSGKFMAPLTGLRIKRRLFRGTLAVAVLLLPHSISLSQEHAWTVKLSDRTSIDSLTLERVDRDSLRATRNNSPVAISMGSIVELRQSQRLNAVASGLLFGVFGMGIGEIEYQQRMGYSEARTGLDLVNRLPYYAGGFALGMGVGSLFAWATEQDDIYAFENLSRRAKFNTVSLILSRKEPVPVPIVPTEIREAKNAIYVEAFGPGLLYSVNYERFVAKEFSVRAGFSSFTLGQSDGDNTTIVVPVMGTYFAGEGSNKLEIGVGIDFWAEREPHDSNNLMLLITSLGYRYQPVDGGFQFRVVATPLIAPAGALLWFGTSVGVCF